MNRNKYHEKSKLKRAYLFLFLFLASFLFAPTIQGQISLSLKKGTLEEAIESIKKQSDYHFFYEDQLADVLVDNIQVSDKKIEEALDILLKGSDVDYIVSDNVVYLSRKDNRIVEAVATSSSVQQKKKIVITGKVTDELNEPLIGVSIFVKDAPEIGTITDIEGNYTLEIFSENSQLQFSYIGYAMKSVVVGNKTVINVSMKEDSLLMDEVVVTALGIKREKKLLGYSIQELKSEELNKTGNASVAGALQGKIAGVQMNIASTGLNGSNKITIRGNSSFSDNNQPLWVVDGIPYGDDGGTSTVARFGGIDRGGNSIDLNPDDIESISILKGPNAAALYGSRAGNGVVLVTTKKGVGKEGLGISYGTTFTWTDVAETLDMQTTYGQGLNGVYDSKTPYSYGEKLEGQSVSAWWDNTETTAYKQYGTKLRDYFNTGFSQNHNLSIGNMDENSHYRLSLGYLDSKGLFEGESLNKINVDLNSGRKINKFLSMDSKISLSKTRAENRPYLGIYGEMYQLVYLPNNINLSDLESNYTRKAIDEQTGSEYDLHKNWVGPTQDIRNPYWVRNQRTNMDERWRVFGYHSMKANITDWLWVSGKAALDYYRTKIEETDKGFGGKIEDIIMNSQLDKSEINFYEINLDAMIQGYNNIGEKIRVDYTVGVNSSYRNNESLEASARNMAEQGKWYLNNAGQQVVNMEGGGIPTYANQTLTRKKVNSVFGLLQFAYDEYLSLDFTLRNDWSSTLPPENNSYDYPSINLSFLGTEFIKKVGGTLPSWWTFGKLRASFAKAGKDTKEYTLDNYKYWRQSFTGPLFSYASMAVNRDLVPEINTSFEGGLEMKFFDNRLGFDLTGYHSVTDGQIMMVPNSTSSIFKYRRVNAGVVKNVGVEFALYSSIIRTKDFNFDLNLNVSHNVSTVEDLYKGVTYIDLDRDNLFIQVGAVEGGKLGDIYAKSKIKRDADGNMIINEYTGLPETDTKSNREERKIGNIQPKMLASLTPQISYKNFHISALFDMRLGGEIVSVTEAIATQFGTAKRTEDRNETIILPGVYANGETNTKSIRREDYYRFISDAGGNSGMAEEFIYDASYIKLRELSAGYSLPTKWLKKTPFQTFRLSFVARDLCYLFKNTPGTTPEGGFDTTMYSQAMDFLAIPNNRTIGFSVNVSF